MVQRARTSGSCMGSDFFFVSLFTLLGNVSADRHHAKNDNDMYRVLTASILYHKSTQGITVVFSMTGSFELRHKDKQGYLSCLDELCGIVHIAQVRRMSNESASYVELLLWDYKAYL